MNIEIITTLNQSLKETGFGGMSSCQNVVDSIQKTKHSVRLSLCNSIADLQDIVKRIPDLAILGVKYISLENGQDIWLSEYFAKNGIHYSGSSREILKFDSDKVLAKLHLQDKGIPTARFFTASEGEYNESHSLPLKYPLFLKPNNAANSNGIDEQSLVSTFDEFEQKISSLQKRYGQATLVEEYLSSKEFTVAIMQTSGGKQLSSAIEIVPPKSKNGQRILGVNTKNKNTETLKKITNQHIKRQVNQLALQAFSALKVEGFGRIDIKTNALGKYFFMEANLVPGMTFGSSYFPEAFRIDQNLSYDQTVSHIVENCLSEKMKNMKSIYSISDQRIEATLN